MLKYQRNYVLQVQAQSASQSAIVIKPPFTLEFDISRKTTSDSNVATLRIYNLSPKTRNQLHFDQFNGETRTCQFLAGYGGPENFHTLFAGTITRCWSVREDINFITEIQGFDGGSAYLNAVIDAEDNTSGQFPAGTTWQTIIKSLMRLVAQITNVPIGPNGIGTFPGVTRRGYVASGNIIDRLQEISGNCYYIDNNKQYCIQKNEALFTSTADLNQVPLINGASGLLSTPFREQQWLTFDMLFEPKLSLSQLIRLDSQFGDPNYQGLYKVLSLQHRGVISEAVSGTAITTVGVNYGKAYSATGAFNG